MPMINIEYDDSKVSEPEITELSEGIQKIVSEVTGIEDVFVYGNSAKVKLKVAPIEIFISMSDHKVPDLDKLFDEIRRQLENWKKQVNFKQPINLTVIPMHWKFEVGI